MAARQEARARADAANAAAIATDEALDKDRNEAERAAAAATARAVDQPPKTSRVR